MMSFKNHRKHTKLLIENLIKAREWESLCVNSCRETHCCSKQEIAN